jgi:hypothetical protein
MGCRVNRHAAPQRRSVNNLLASASRPPLTPRWRRRGRHHKRNKVTTAVISAARWVWAQLQSTAALVERINRSGRVG